jgi:hypothetical protein
MEKTEKTILQDERPIEQVKGDWGVGGCSFWIFGDDDSARNDLKEKFEIRKEEK